MPTSTKETPAKEATHKVTGQVQSQIKEAIGRIPEAQRPTQQAVAAAFRSTGSVPAAVKQAMSPPAAVTAKPEAPAAVSQPGQPAAAPSVTAKAVTAPKTTVASPAGWEPGYSANGFERYKRRLKENGHPVTCYRIAAANTNERKALVQSWRDAKLIDDDAVFVMVNHTTGATFGFTNWADCYAASRANGSPALARSVVASIGGDPGIVRLKSRLGLELTRRIQAIIADDEKADEEKEEAPVSA